MIAYLALRVLQLLCIWLPRPVRSLLIVAIGTTTYWILPDKRANAQHNLRVILAPSGAGGRTDERRVRRLARRSMVAYVGTMVDFLRLERLREAVVRDTAPPVTGWEHLDTALAAGRGVAFVTPHFGHWDLAAVALAAHCPPDTIHAVAESFSDPRLDELVLGKRRDYGIAVIGMDAVREMVRVLRAGKVLGLLADRPVGPDDGVPVTFFGHRTHIPAGAAVLASLARCPIVPGYLRLRPDGRWEGRILPSIEPVRTGDRERDVQATMQLVVEALERIISRSPHQWYMFRAMWADMAPGRRDLVAAAPAAGSSARAARHPDHGRAATLEQTGS